QCPSIKVVCSNRVAGDGSPLHCSATLEGPSSTNIIYRWNVSARAPIQTVSGKPDEVEVNLDGNSDRVIRVTVTINGLPEECEDSAYFDSFLAELGPQAQARANAAPADTTSPNAANDNVAPSTTTTCSEIVTEGEAAYFSVNIDGVEPGATPIYSWAVSQGSIKKGQGTASIAVDTTDLGGAILKATAHVGGFSSPLTVSCTTMVKRVPKAY